MVFREIKRILGFILVILITVSAYCQTSSAIFKSDYPFQITINHIKQQEVYSKNSIVYKLSGERPYNIKINFENDTAFIQKNIYIMVMKFKNQTFNLKLSKSRFYFYK